MVVVKDFYSKLNSTTYFGIDDIQIKFVERYDEVYGCNIDSDSCLDLDGDVYKNVFWQENIVVGSNVFTDFTSTSMQIWIENRLSILITPFNLTIELSRSTRSEWPDMQNTFL